jgi:hypothetical protein
MTAPDALRSLAENLWEELGGDLCICQRPDVSIWCEKCQQRIDLIASALRRVADDATRESLEDKWRQAWRRDFGGRHGQ